MATKEDSSPSDSPPAKLSKISNVSSSLSPSSSMPMADVYKNPLLFFTVDIEMFLEEVALSRNCIPNVKSWLSSNDVKISDSPTSTVLEDAYCKLITESFQLPNKVECRRKIKPVERLGVLTSSVEILPDICIYESETPILFILVQSRTYHSTIIKCATNTVDLMRAHLSQKEEARELYGFVFPKAVKEAGKIIQICVQFVPPMIFDVQFTSVHPDELKEKLTAAVSVNLRNAHIGRLTCSFFLRIPRSFYSSFGDLGVTEQLPSRHSVVLANDSDVFKYIPLFDERETARFFLEHEEKSQLQYVLCPKEFIRLPYPAYKVVLFKYDRISRCPIQSKDDVTADIIKELYKALLELHGTFKCAHLDIRPANIGLNEKSSKLTLIDLDRARGISEPFYPSMFSNKSCMYQMPSGVNAKDVTNKIMDYVQLGFMLVWWLGESSFRMNTDYHDMKPEDVEELAISEQWREFLEKLISEGECSLELLS